VTPAFWDLAQLVFCFLSERVRSSRFNRNQGEVARTYYALTQSQFLEKAAEQQAMTDVENAYETLLNSQEIVQLYNGG
jgi:hypothetical protein